MLHSKETKTATTHDFEKLGLPFSGISDVRFSLCTLEKKGVFVHWRENSKTRIVLQVPNRWPGQMI